MEVQSFHALYVTKFLITIRGLRPEPANNERERKQQNIFSQENVPIEKKN